MLRRLARPALLAAAIAAAPLLWPAAAQQQPERSLRVVSGAAAGGSSDFVSRLVADAVGPLLGARAVVENRTGVNGVVAAEMVARSTPDGATVFTCPMSTMAITPQLVGANLPIDPGAELAPIATVALSSYGFVVAASGPYRSVPDVLDAAQTPSRAGDLRQRRRRLRPAPFGRAAPAAHGRAHGPCALPRRESRRGGHPRRPHGLHDHQHGRHHPAGAGRGAAAAGDRR